MNLQGPAEAKCGKAYRIDPTKPCVSLKLQLEEFLKVPYVVGGLDEPKGNRDRPALGLEFSL